MTHTHTLIRTPLGERSVLRRYFCLITHQTPKNKSMFPSGSEHAIGKIEQPLTPAIDGAASGINKYKTYDRMFIFV